MLDGYRTQELLEQFDGWKLQPVQVYLLGRWQPWRQKHSPYSVARVFIPAPDATYYRETLVNSKSICTRSNFSVNMRVSQCMYISKLSADPNVVSQ